MDWLGDANTQWVAEQLARHAEVSARDVGYAGLKDRRAVTTQWFSVLRKAGVNADWASFSAEGVEILESHRHKRKLRRGAHRGNAFRIAIRSDAPLPRDGLSERLEQITEQGVPNYFGEQRFGRDAANLELGRAVVAGRRVSRHKRSIGLSALRSYQFNEELDARVREGSWNTLLQGDVANLEGTGSVFAVEEVTAELEQRCHAMDIHPCGTLPGFDSVRVEPGTRALRMRINGLTWEVEDETLWLEFDIRRGSFATVVLRELASLQSG